MKTNPSIAIADDHDQYRDGLRDILTTWGYAIDIAAGNGEELIKLIEASASLPDICIMDVEMPVMNGTAATSIIKQRWPSVKVIGHSMNTRDSIQENILKAGADAFVAKGEMSNLKLALDELTK